MSNSTSLRAHISPGSLEGGAREPPSSLLTVPIVAVCHPSREEWHRVLCKLNPRQPVLASSRSRASSCLDEPAENFALPPSSPEYASEFCLLPLDFAQDSRVPGAVSWFGLREESGKSDSIVVGVMSWSSPRPGLATPPRSRRCAQPDLQLNG
ncbi:hypothetical protein QAD02_024440 [Eretmocerus hayati]|uniref:Uncharacterized protein n=1 Tax=Eretmocerus hayati TaxID=131215 RepID=A0ACC2PYF2_9HYME|nr:hypothetical protein QAD02_024440 [Eretmocerus hayati]